jgi:hypothetical protein
MERTRAAESGQRERSVDGQPEPPLLRAAAGALQRCIEARRKDIEPCAGHRGHRHDFASGETRRT